MSRSIGAICRSLCKRRARYANSDACAAPGGKTPFAERYPDASSRFRQQRALERVTENLARLNLSAEVVCADAADLRHRLLIDSAGCTLHWHGRYSPPPRYPSGPRSGWNKRYRKVKTGNFEPLLALTEARGTVAVCHLLGAGKSQTNPRFLDHARRLETLTATGSIPVPAGLQLLPGLGEGDGFYYASLIKSASSQGVTA